jgi:hypothetical protein
MGVFAVHSVLPLAAAPTEGRAFAQLLPWLGLLLVLVLIGAVAIYIARRTLYWEPPRSAPGFSLQSLREMHEAGELSDEEFERARTAMISRIKTPSVRPSEGPAAPAADSADAHGDAAPDAAAPQRGDAQESPEQTDGEPGRAE